MRFFVPAFPVPASVVAVAGILCLAAPVAATVYSVYDLDPFTGGEIVGGGVRPEAASLPVHVPVPVSPPISAPVPVFSPASVSGSVSGAGLRGKPGKEWEDGVMPQSVGALATVKELLTFDSEGRNDSPQLGMPGFGSGGEDTEGVYDIRKTAQYRWIRNVVQDMRRLADDSLRWTLLDGAAFGKASSPGREGESLSNSGNPKTVNRGLSATGSAWNRILEGSAFAGKESGFGPGPESTALPGHQSSADPVAEAVSDSHGGTQAGAKKDVKTVFSEWWDKLMWELSQYGLVTYP